MAACSLFPHDDAGAFIYRRLLEIRIQQALWKRATGRRWAMMIGLGEPTDIFKMPTPLAIRGDDSRQGYAYGHHLQL